MQWLGVASGFLLLVWLWKYVRPRPILGLAFFFIFFQILLRTLASIFLDAFGPVYAIELDDEVGGSGATFAWAMVVVMTVLIVAAFLSPKFVAKGLAPPRLVPSESGTVTVGDVGFWLSASMVAAMYIDMFSGGVIPLLEGLERWEYTENYAGALHKWFFEYGILLVCFLGVLSVYPRVRGGETDLRYVGLLGVIFVYAVLAGHRFSIFYAFGAYFLIPRAVVFMSGVRAADPSSRNSRMLRRMVTSRPARLLAVVVVLGGIGGALANSLVNVRGFAPALAAFSFAQRALVQPQQMWFLTYDRVFLKDDYDPSKAADFLFFDPLDPIKNTTAQFLMSQALGEARTMQILDAGSQYAGGFPEIFFELTGPYFGWLLVALQAVGTAVLLRELLRSVYEGRLLSAFAVLYVLFALLITYIGGMLNNYVVAMFWFKVAFMCTVLLLEKGRDGLPRPLIPWVLWRSRRASASARA